MIEDFKDIKIIDEKISGKRKVIDFNDTKKEKINKPRNRAILFSTNQYFNGGN